MFEDCTLEQKQQTVVVSLGEASALDYFNVWLSSQKPDRLSLNDWSLEELKDMIDIYKSTVEYCRGSPEKNADDHGELNTIDMLGMNSHADNANNDVSVEKPVQKKSNSKLVHALSMQLEQTSSMKIERVRVSKVDKEKKGMFGSRNIYWMATEGEGWHVPRRLSDFTWLSERLAREFPGMSVDYCLDVADDF